MKRRKLLYIGGGVLIFLAAGYFISNGLIRQKVEERIRTLQPNGWRLSIGGVELHGINYLALAISRKHVRAGSVKLTHIQARRGKGLMLEGDVEVDSLLVDDLDKPMDSTNVHFGRVKLALSQLVYTIPGAYSQVRVAGLMLDSRQGELQIDSMRLIPTVSKLELGVIKGHQTDVVSAAIAGVKLEGFDMMGLVHDRLTAERISIRHSHIYVFRDRRLPLVTDVKPMPVEYLKNLPVSIRVGMVKMESGSFTYEEFPKKGNKTGVLKIDRLSTTVRPLINHREANDPDYVTVTSSGSLMGSGTVNTVMKMPLRKNDPYKVEGAFHELDVTSLNPSAENLGDIHLESGILNSLSFSFDMSEERATGQIVGEYHDLVVDKLKGKDDKKVDKLKSFFLKALIIPKNKDKSLRVSKRTGKVDYKRDPQRFFSYYMLHALLVGVKSSFSLGFLLPG
jgi:hypothetical protein